MFSDALRVHELGHHGRAEAQDAGRDVVLDDTLCFRWLRARYAAVEPCNCVTARHNTAAPNAEGLGASIIMTPAGRASRPQHRRRRPLAAQGVA